MKPKQDTSYGVVPFTKIAGEWKVFLIYQYGSAGDIFWTFPKGHPEADETPEESAKRELLEETGLIITELKTEFPLIQAYQFKHDGELIDKTVTYFVGVATTSEFMLQADEVREAGWFTLAQASEQLTHGSAKEILTQAIAILKAGTD